MRTLKVLMTAVFCTLAMYGVQAQLQLGVKAGASMSTTYGSPEKFEDENIESVGLRPGFQAGLTLALPITSFLGVMGEVNYENRNGLKDINVDATIPTGAGNVLVSTEAELRNSFNYLNIPILATLGGEKMKVYVGPNFAYLLSATSKRTTTTTVVLPDGVPADSPGLPMAGTTETEIDFINDAPYKEDGSFINQFDLGANLGLMFMLTEHLNLDLRVNHGLTDATNNEYDFSIIDGSSREDADRNVSIQLSVGYGF